jgi:8-oxo-dGTP diphosphatase
LIKVDSSKVKLVSEIDWSQWQARDLATLVFVVKDGKILLIRKKRGLGKGKVNGPGGKLDPGEGAVECAVRECQEELGISVSNLECMGEHKFQFVDGYSIHCWVFKTADLEGVAVELPMVIKGTPFTASWVFDDDHMLDYELEMTDHIEIGSRKA